MPSHSSDETSKLSLSHKEVNVSPFTISVNLWGWVNPWLTEVCHVEDFGTMASVFRGDEMDFYVDRGLFMRAHDRIRRLIEREKLPIELAISRSHELGGSTLKTCLENYRRISDMYTDDLATLMARLFAQGRELCSFGYIAPLSDWPEEYLSERMAEILQAKCPSGRAEAFLLLTTPLAQKPSALALDELYETTAVGKPLDEWLARWFWLDFGHIGQVLTLKGLPEKYPEIQASPQDILQKLHKLRKDQNQIQARQDEMAQRLGLTDAERRLFQAAGQLAFLKGYRMDILSCLNAFFDRVFTDYAARFGWDKEIFRLSSLEEVLGYLKTGKADISRIMQRRPFTVWTLDEAKGFDILTGDQATSFMAARLMVQDQTIEQDLIKGYTAYPGVVRGTVRIVKNPSDLTKVQEGDVLVAVQTTPELLPGMKQAVAFVTDIGGITSHAAIVSREMRKPCVVGTKNATQMLKDGDRVKVDADHGYIMQLVD